MTERNVLQDTIRIRLKAIVNVNPKHPSLLQVIAESEGKQSFADILQAEVEANLESLGYVTHVTVEPV